MCHIKVNLAKLRKLEKEMQKINTGGFNCEVLPLRLVRLIKSTGNKLIGVYFVSSIVKAVHQNKDSKNKPKHLPDHQKGMKLQELQT